MAVHSWACRGYATTSAESRITKWCSGSLHCPFPATIGTSTYRLQFGSRLGASSKATARLFAIPPSRSTRGVQYRLSLPSFVVRCKLSPKFPQLSWAVRHAIQRLNLRGYPRGSLINKMAWRVACVDMFGSCVPWPIINSDTS